MMQYNTQSARLVLPEYGRSVQQMVDYCASIPDREERNCCARSIIRIMANLFPDQAANEEGRRRFWDHLNMMANFNLDIDFPFPPVTSDSLIPAPAILPVEKGRIHYRYYGRVIEKMIDTVADMEPGEEKDNLSLILANHLKKLLTIHNHEGVSDRKVLADLAELSGGRIMLDPETTVLLEFREANPQNAQAQKKRKKK